jgi:hypothetical protein
MRINVVRPESTVNAVLFSGKRVAWVGQNLLTLAHIALTGLSRMLADAEQIAVGVFEPSHLGAAWG